MSDTGEQTPPRGDFDKAEKYINQLISLINQNKIEVFHTDLKKFDPTTLHDHYSVSLQEYQIEFSHSKQPNSGRDSYVMIFNNMRQLSEGNGQKVILAYIYLADSQFSKFKLVADRQIEEKRKAEEERRFSEALAPIDQILDSANVGNSAEQVTDYKASNPAASPLMQSFKQEFQEELNSSLDEKKDTRDFANLSQIHQI